MEQDEQGPVAVYDFLYRDRSRIDSFYAQIFGGRFLSLEKTQSVRKQREWKVRATIKVLSAERQGPTEISESSKEVIDPHDAATIDVLQWLSENDFIVDDVEEAKQGHLVKLCGSLLLVDRLLAVATAKSLLSNIPGGKSGRGMKTGAELFAQYPMPSMFTLRADSQSLYAGTLTDEGIEHVMRSHTWKFGQESMNDVHLIGILESAGQQEQAGVATLDPVLNVVQTLHAWFPPSAVRVTPIVMYRRLISRVDREMWLGAEESSTENPEQVTGPA